MRTVIVTSLAVMLALPALLAAQAAPDLSGTWTLDAARSDPQPAAGAAGNQLVITQSPADVVVRQGTVNMPYKTDGTETSYLQQGRIVATARWVGATFVVWWKKELYAGPRDGYVVTSGKDAYSVAGSVLTVEKSTTTRQGTATRKAVYNRT